MHKTIIHCCAAFWLINGLICQGQQQDRLSIEQSSSRWELLPESVNSVVVGPDGRTWFQLDGELKDRSDAGLRASLEREYRHPSPQIVGARIALIEPGGRAWFYVNQAREVWGFDGQKWVDRKAQTGSSFVGRCPTKGQLFDNLVNRATAGKVWLREEQGIHLFDGTNWIYQAICPPLNTVPAIPRFAVSPDGKYAVAITPKTPDRRPDMREPDLWVLEDKDTEWKKRDITWPDKNVVTSFGVTDEGVLHCVFQSGVLWSFPVLAASDARRQANEWIPELEHDLFEARQMAFQKLRNIAVLIRPELEAAQKNSKSREMTQWLETLLQDVTLDSSNRGKINAGAIGTRFGPLVIRNSKAIFQDNRGGLCLFADQISQDSKTSIGGLAILHPDRTAEVPTSRSSKALRLAGNWRTNSSLFAKR